MKYTKHEEKMKRMADFLKDYGLTGRIIHVLHTKGETNECLWGGEIREMRVEAETSRFLVATVLPHRNGAGGNVSRPYRITLDKNLILFQKDRDFINIGTLKLETFIVSTQRTLPIKVCNVSPSRILKLVNEYGKITEFEKLKTYKFSIDDTEQEFYLVRSVKEDSGATFFLKEIGPNRYESLKPGEATRILEKISNKMLKNAS